MLESVLRIFPVHLRERVGRGMESSLGLEEIRVRIHAPVIFRDKRGEHFLSGEEEWQIFTARQERAYRIQEKDMEEMITFLSRYSRYAYEEEIANGFLTLEGGHRVGVAGQVRMKEERIEDISYIRYLNIRIASEQRDCASELLPYLEHEDGIYNTLLFSAPGIGKTTYLRDLVRLLSDRKGLRVSLIDERSEIAACHMGIPQNEVGIRTDIMDRVSKDAGMRMMLRSMAPQILAVDELGGSGDYQALQYALNSGCGILGTAHAGSRQELMMKKQTGLWQLGELFERFVLLKRGEKGRRSFEIYDRELEALC